MSQIKTRNNTKEKKDAIIFFLKQLEGRNLRVSSGILVQGHMEGTVTAKVDEGWGDIKFLTDLQYNEGVNLDKISRSIVPEGDFAVNYESQIDSLLAALKETKVCIGNLFVSTIKTIQATYDDNVITNVKIYTKEGSIVAIDVVK